MHGEGGVHGKGWHAWRRGHAWQRGHRWHRVCMAGGVRRRGFMHGKGMHARETTTETGGTHATGVHSCLYLVSFNLLKSLKPGHLLKL